MPPDFPIYRIFEKDLPYFRDFAAWLEAKIVTPSLTISTKDTLSFLLKVLQLTFESQGDPQWVYPLIIENLDLLEPHLIYILRKWARQTFPYVCLNRIVIIASALVNFGRIVWALPDGDSDVNLEIALACCELALEIYDLEMFPTYWGKVNNNIALIYQTRSYGNHAHNLIKSFEYYQRAKLIFPEQSFPEKWSNIMFA